MSVALYAIRYTRGIEVTDKDEEAFDNLPSYDFDLDIRSLEAKHLSNFSPEVQTALKKMLKKESILDVVIM